VEFFFKKNPWGPLQPPFFSLASGKVLQFFFFQYSLFFLGIGHKRERFSKCLLMNIYQDVLESGNKHLQA